MIQRKEERRFLNQVFKLLSVRRKFRIKFNAQPGAILLYLADSYGGSVTPIQRAKYTKWVVWANSELDYLCFGKGMSGTMLDKVSSLFRIEKILSF